MSVYLFIGAIVYLNIILSQQVFVEKSFSTGRKMLLTILIWIIPVAFSYVVASFILPERRRLNDVLLS